MWGSAGGAQRAGALPGFVCLRGGGVFVSRRGVVERDELCEAEAGVICFAALPFGVYRVCPYGFRSSCSLYFVHLHTTRVVLELDYKIVYI